MNDSLKQVFNERWIISNRSRKNILDPQKPYGWMVEKERTASGKIEDTGIIFLTNSECPFHCLMCDLWKNTTDNRVQPGVIPGQVEWGLKQMPGVKHLKLYNSGSFFDPRAIPVTDYVRIASLLEGLETVIVESHPKFINGKSLIFNKMLKPELQVAIGLESVNSELLEKLNKKMTPLDFSNSVDFLRKNSISSRAFILLRTPFMSEEEGIYWAERSIDFAFESGIECCTVIPVRGGNGAMEILKEQGLFHPPSLQSLETVLEYGISLNAGPVFADVWDLRLFSGCNICTENRIARITEMNLSQIISQRVECSCLN